jgi:electron transfer flavoprotein beta subunit
MKILVCIKQGDEPGTISRFDQFALESALRIREQFFAQKIQVDVVTVGPESAADTIKRAYGMGADQGIHLLSETAALLPAQVIALHLKPVAHDYDLIFTGIMSQDMMAGQTGPMLAALLEIPCTTAVVKIRFSPDKRQVAVERELENNRTEALTLSLPALLTIQAGINTPRYPSLSHMLAAGRKKIHTCCPPRLSLDFMCWVPEVVGFETPPKTRAGHCLKGPLPDQVQQLKQFLQKKDLI